MQQRLQPDPVLGEEALVQVKLRGDLRDLSRGGLGASREGDGRVARDDEDERVDAEGDEEQQENSDEQPTTNERREGSATGRHRRRLAQRDPVRRYIVQSPVVLAWPTTGATS